MNADQQNNIEQSINGLCKNLVWSWAYFRSLSGLHEIAKSSPPALDPYPQLVSCLYHGLFDALFLRLYHFVDKSKGATGLPSLFKQLRRYYPDDNELSGQINCDEKRLIEIADLNKIGNWRNQVVAHLTCTHRNSKFFTDNRLHFSEIHDMIVTFESMVEYYSMRLLKRGNDTHPPSEAVAAELAQLLLRGHGKFLGEEVQTAQ